MKISLEVISIRLTPDGHELVVRGDAPDGKFNAEFIFTENTIDLTEE